MFSVVPSTQFLVEASVSFCGRFSLSMKFVFYLFYFLFYFLLFCKVLRIHSCLLHQLFVGCIPAGMPELTDVEDAQYLADHLHVSLSDKEASKLLLVRGYLLSCMLIGCFTQLLFDRQRYNPAHPVRPALFCVSMLLCG